MTRENNLPRNHLRITSLVLLGVLLAISTMGCTHGRKRVEIELWLIDHEDLVLYRDLEDGLQQAIPIKGNADMEKFIVIDREEYLRYLLDAIERGE